MARLQIAAMRAVECAAGAGVSATHVFKQFSEILLDIGAFGAVLEPRFEQTFERKERFWKRAVRPRIDRFLETMQSLDTRGGDGCAMRGHFALQAAKPCIIENAIRERAVGQANMKRGSNALPHSA